ncbi:carbohydrate ABC transporter permease [Aureibacillus halotolerans]|uniref:Multiple sugar transport system permease protein n=1 Tax=Aureibacillus halotolerans TaxID=1508390 RepID=A0A4R6TW46_9BACI|nr:sugar ABC transporter permease [Aureibacillus halotolerans]TDQ37661.1 multiple sugar transport system permease protein [Aureibacillus halotolerans]
MMLKTRKARDNLWAGFFLAPQLIGLLLFTIGPVVFAFVISFMEWNIGSKAEWIGTENYQEQWSDPLFWKVLGNTVQFAIMYIPLTLIGALIVALLLNLKVKGRTVFRTMFFMPVVTSTVAVALVWSWMYNPDYGLINAALSVIGVEGPGWLTSTTWALPSVVILAVWQGIGYNMILFLAGLQSVSPQLYEAARIDGANTWQRFRSITLPMISPTTFFILIMLLINAFQVFNEPYMMTKGGPANETNVIVLHIYQTAFQFFQMGAASSLAFTLFFIILIFTLIQFKFSKWVNYDA